MQAWWTALDRGIAIKAMLNPCHPGEILRDNLEAAGLSVTEAASRLGCTRRALSRLLNGKPGISPAMALALERPGWSNASYGAGQQGGKTGVHAPGARVSVLQSGLVPEHWLVSMVPKINLLDAHVEPSDADLEALMLDFQRVVAIRREAAQEAFFANLATTLEDAARENLTTERSLSSSSFGNAS